MVVSDFATFVLDQLPPPPGRVLEVGCGGGRSRRVAGGAGYDVLGVDPTRPRAGLPPRALPGLDGDYDAVVAGRVLHHVNPLDDGIAKLARLAPLLVVDEFARDRIDAAAQRLVRGRSTGCSRAAGATARARRPRRVGDAASRPALGRHGARRAARAYDEHVFERIRISYRWLGGPSSEALDRR